MKILNIHSVTGKDWWAWHFLPGRARKLRYLAKRLARSEGYKGRDEIEKGSLVFAPPDFGGHYAVTRADGQFEKFDVGQGVVGF